MVERVRNPSHEQSSYRFFYAYGSAAEWDTCFFTSYDLAQSTTCGSVSKLQVGRSVNLSQFTHHLLKLGYSSRERRGGSLTTKERYSPLLSTGWGLHCFTVVIWTRVSNSGNMTTPEVSGLLKAHTRKTPRLRSIDCKSGLFTSWTN